MPTAYGYPRVSTKKQVKSQLGLRAQQRMIEDYYRLRLRAQKVRWGRLYADKGVSAYRQRLIHRPNGRKLMEILEPGDHVIVPKVDRAFRSSADCMLTLTLWQDRGVHVHLLDLGVDTTTSSGRMVAGIMAQIAEWESQRIGERIKEALEERRAQGRATNSQPPVGYKQRRKRWEPCHAERRLARRMLARRKAGESASQIAEALNREGRRNRRRRPWNIDSVLRWSASAAAGFPRRGLHNRRRGHAR
jgi:DNA invertase Pin-like site-specific DNA recombinase